MSFKSICFLFAFSAIATLALSQEVTVSQEFNLRNDYSYDVVGRIGENIVLFRDSGFEYKLEVMGEDLSYKKKTEIIFEKSKVDVIEIVKRDTSFTIYYSYKLDGLTNISTRTFNEKAEPIDTSVIYVEKTKVFKKKFELKESEDRSKVLLYSVQSKSELNVITIDQDSLALIYDDLIVFDDVDLNSDFETAAINNKAEVFLLLDVNNRRIKKKDHYVEVNYVSPLVDDIQTIKIPLSDLLCSDVKLHYDNYNENILVTGLYHDKNKLASKGYFYVQHNKNNFLSNPVAHILAYKEDVLREINGKGKDREEDLQHFKIYDVIFRRDGGFVLITEMNKELSRRTYYNGYNRFNNETSGGVWMDYYNENIVLFAIKPSGLEHWTKVLHKKQFSQDDDNIYGSFFAFRSPSRLRLLYNDEIRKNNTVSEYVVDPVGDSERNSVMNTDYQNSRLRFRDAIQISSNELLVPSQRSYTLNIVKIKY